MGSSSLCILWQICMPLKVKFKWPWSNAMNSARQIKFVGQYVIPGVWLWFSSLYLLYPARSLVHHPPAMSERGCSCCCPSDYSNSFSFWPVSVFGFNSLYAQLLAHSLLWLHCLVSRLFGRLQLINWPVMRRHQLCPWAQWNNKRKIFLFEWIKILGKLIIGIKNSENVSS